MNVKEKMNEIEDILKQEGFSISWKITDRDVSLDRSDCFWMDNGVYATIENDKYRIDAGVYGGIRYTLYDEKGEEIVTSKRIKDLQLNGITNDKELYEAFENGNIAIHENSWIELPIYDKEEQKYITDTFDGLAIIPDSNNIFEAIDGGFTEYIEGFTNEEVYEKE